MLKAYGLRPFFFFPPRPPARPASIIDGELGQSASSKAEIRKPRETYRPPRDLLPARELSSRPRDSRDTSPFASHRLSSEITHRTRRGGAGREEGEGVGAIR
jgi:hypothetical protein